MERLDGEAHDGDFLVEELAVARRVGRDEGIAIGKEEGIAIGKEQALLTAIEALADVLSVELTTTRRAELTASGADALAQRLDSLRRLRSWV